MAGPTLKQVVDKYRELRDVEKELRGKLANCQSAMKAVRSRGIAMLSEQRKQPGENNHLFVKYCELVLIHEGSEDK
jgi:hypothetical protein